MVVYTLVKYLELGLNSSFGSAVDTEGIHGIESECFAFAADGNALLKSVMVMIADCIVGLPQKAHGSVADLASARARLCLKVDRKL